MPGIGPILDYFTDHPYQWLHDKVDEWGKAGPHAVVQGLTNLYLGNYAKGAHQVATGAAVTAAPMVAPELLGALAAAPVATGSALATGTAATIIAAPPAKKLAVAAGLTEDQAQLVEDAVGLGAGYVGAKATPQNLVTAGKVALSHVPGFRGLRAAGTLIDAAGEALASQRAAEATAAERVPSASAPPVATPEESVAERIDRIIAEGRAQGAAQAAAAQAPAVPPVTSRPATAQDALAARTIAEARATPVPAPAPVEPPATTTVVAPAAVPRPPAPSLRVTGRWGPGESQGALRQAAEQAGYPISDGELKAVWPSVQAAGADGGPAVAALHVERMQARAALVGNAATMTPAAFQAALEETGLSEMAASRIVQQTHPAAAVTPAVAPVGVSTPPAVAAPPVAPVPAPAGPVSVAPVAAPPTPRPIMSPQMALNEVGLAARRLQVPMTLDEARAAAEFLQQGSTPPRAIQQWMDAGRPALEAPPVPPAPVRVPGPRDSIMSPTRAGSEVAIAARRLNVPLTPAQTDEAAAFVLNEGLTPKAAIARWMETTGAPAADAAVPSVLTPPPAAAPVAAPTREELAADLATRLGTPTPEAVQAALDARYVRGELKTPSGPTAARMKAEADARLAAPSAPVAAVVEPPALVATAPASPAAVYDQARADARAASATFDQAQQAYRARTIDDETFLAARRAFTQSQQAFDRAESAFIDATNAGVAPAAPVAKAKRTRASTPAAATVVAPTTPADTPTDAAQTVTQQIARVIDTQGLKSGAAVQARVMKTLTEELNGARDAAGFGDITTQRRGSAGGNILLDGEPVAYWDKGGAVRWYGGGTGMHGRDLGPAADVIAGVPASTPIGQYPINARNMTPGEVERAAKNAVASTVSRTRGAGQLKISVPGDGTFTIDRNPHAINELMKRLQSGGVSLWKDLL
jgi:hypothetical protein